MKASLSHSARITLAFFLGIFTSVMAPAGHLHAATFGVTTY